MLGNSLSSDDQVEELRKIRNRALNKEKGTIRIDGHCNAQGELAQSFFEAYSFSEDATHTISLTMLVLPALFPNLDDTCNKFFYNDGNIDKEFTIDTGCYNIDEYGKMVQAKIKQLGDNPENIKILLNTGSGKVIIEIKNNYKVYFKTHSWFRCLGFNLNQTLTNGISISSRIANVTPTQVVNIECDLVDPRCNKFNGKQSQVLFSFPVDAVFGELLTFTNDPNKTAKTLGKKHFDSVCLKFYDTNHKPITAMNKEINVELQIIQT